MDRLAPAFSDNMFQLDNGMFPSLEEIETLDARYMLPGDVPRFVFDHYTNTTGAVMGFEFLGHPNAQQRQSPSPSTTSSSSSSHLPFQQHQQYHPYQQLHQQDEPPSPFFFQHDAVQQQVTWIENNYAPPMPQPEPLVETSARAQAHGTRHFINSHFESGHKVGKP